MRITLDLSEDLLAEAQASLGLKSKTDTVAVALRELVRRQRIEKLKALMGQVELSVDLQRSRRRPC